MQRKWLHFFVIASGPPRKIRKLIEEIGTANKNILKDLFDFLHRKIGTFNFQKSLNLVLF